MKNAETSLNHDDPEAFTTLTSNFHCKKIGKSPLFPKMCTLLEFLIKKKIKDKRANVDSGIGYQNFTSCD